MDDPAGGELVAAGEPRLARAAFAERLALFGQPETARPVHGRIYPEQPAPLQGRIRGVHDGVHAQASEVTEDKANPVRYGQRHPSLRFLAERSSSVAWTGWAVQAPSTGR
jgi:hypothetical protein